MGRLAENRHEGEEHEEYCAELAPAPKPKLKKATATYACVPGPILLNPPIRHHHMNYGLSPFEFGILWAVLASQRSGKELTRTGLLRLAGISTGTKELGRIDAALDKLCSPVGDLGPPLLSWNGDKKLTFALSPNWLPASGFSRLPRPPLSGPVTLSLWLLVWGLNPKAKDFRNTPLKKLCATIGITSRDGYERSLGRVFALINKHLGTLDREALAAEGIYLPTHYTCDIDEDNRVYISTKKPRGAKQREVEREVEDERSYDPDDDNKYYCEPDGDNLLLHTRPHAQLAVPDSVEHEAFDPEETADERLEREWHKYDHLDKE